MKKYGIAIACFACLAAVTSVTPASAATVEPSWTPVPGEYYPTDHKRFPNKVENPNPQVRDVVFSGKPQDIFTKINMVTQIQLPEPPMIVNVGNPEAYVIDVVPEISSLFIKPIAETDMTNLIVTGERGTYIFMLKENPYKPFDVLVRFGDPRPARDLNADLMAMAVSGRRDPRYAHTAVEIRSPNTSAYFYDAVLGVGGTASLRRVVYAENTAIYHLKITNHVQGVSTDRLSDYVFDEKSVVATNLRGVAVQDGGSNPLIKVGEEMDLFLYTGGQPGPRLRFRFSLRGNSSAPTEIDISTVSEKTIVVPATEELDAKLQRLYLEAEKKRGTGGTTGGTGGTTGGTGGTAGDAKTGDGIVIFRK